MRAERVFKKRRYGIKGANGFVLIYWDKEETDE